VIGRPRWGTEYIWYEEEPDPASKRRAVWLSIDRAFAEPTTQEDDVGDYVATQIIAELFKRHEFDGVAYKSNFGDYGRYGQNIALFDLDAAELVRRGLYTVESIDMTFIALEEIPDTSGD
jgi:hypothetical protein